MSQALSGRRVLVTGVAGQLGGYLRPALEDAGATVLGVGREPGPGIDMVAELTERADVALVFWGARPHLVLHAAAWTDVDAAERDEAGARAANVDAARHVAQSARSCGAHLVAVSTDFVFSGTGGAPYAEDAPTDPVSAYGRTKRAGEEAVLAVDPSFAVARTAWLYGGPGKHFPRTVLSVLRTRGAMEVVADEAGSPTFAGDLAVALVALAATEAGGVFHLTNEGRATRYELAREVAALASLDPEMVRPTTTAAFLAKYPLPAKRPADSELRNVRAAALGVALRPWPEALAAYVPVLAAESGPGVGDRAPDARG